MKLHSDAATTATGATCPVPPGATSPDPSSCLLGAEAPSLLPLVPRLSRPSWGHLTRGGTRRAVARLERLCQSPLPPGVMFQGSILGFPPEQACSGVFLRLWSWQHGPGARRSLILLPRAEHAKAGGARLAGACRQEQLPLWCSRFLLKLGHCLASPPRSVGNVIAPWAAKSEHAGRETRARERGEARPTVIWEVQRIRESLPIPTHSPRACYNSALPGFLPPPGMTDPKHAGSGRRGFGELCSVSWGLQSLLLGDPSSRPPRGAFQQRGFQQRGGDGTLCGSSLPWSPASPGETWVRTSPAGTYVSPGTPVGGKGSGRRLLRGSSVPQSCAPLERRGMSQPSPSWTSGGAPLW